MAITVDSSQWTGHHDDTPLPVPVVWGEFADEAAREEAVSQLRRAGARQENEPAAADAGGVASPERAINEEQVSPPDEHPHEADARNQRQLEVGTAMAATSMGAAGLVIATGGTVLPAIAAALAAGAATAAVGEPIAEAISPQPSEQEGALSPPARAAGPVVGLKAPDADTRERAERALREAGARRIFVQETRAG